VRISDLGHTVSVSGADQSGGWRRWRRYWPEYVLLFGVALVLLAIPVGIFTSSRLVLLGSLNAFRLAGGLIIGGVWCVAAYLIGRVTKSANGRIPETLALLFAVPVLLGGLVLTGIIGIATALLSDTGPRYVLDVPGTSSHYLVTTFTFGETSLTLYRGNGTIYKKLEIRPPIVDRSVAFENSYHVETDSKGRSSLVYPKEGGGDARVPLPYE
jgi:hypothetical protein